MINYKDCKWGDEDHTYFVCQVEHPTYGWIPYCCMAGDNSIGKELWEQRNSLKIAEYKPDLEAMARGIRIQRNQLLKQTDYLMVLDAPISDKTQAEVKEYRQALRDLPLQDGFPLNVVWPKKPEV